jgi:hypothetical protein
MADSIQQFANGKSLPDLRAPFNSMSMASLADHFHNLRCTHYFAVVDPMQTHRRKIDGILSGHFSFNGESFYFPDQPPWAVNPSTDLEWHILLHKFYFGIGLAVAWHETDNKRYRNKWIELTGSWINQIGQDYTISHAMQADASQVAGRRIQNWIYAYYYFVDQSDAAEIPTDFHFLFLTSLQQQVDYLINNLSARLNHRTLELYAVFLAAVVFPEFCHAQRWLHLSLAELEKNIQQDLLPDGVHRELSTHYHHLALRNYINVRRLASMNNISVTARFDAAIVRALEFSLHIHKPDGIVPSLSDGDARSYTHLLKLGAELYQREDMLFVATQGVAGVAPAARTLGFPDSGYYVLRSGWGEDGSAYADQRYLVFDCGPLGAGNHGHIDLLSFEAAAFGRSLIVDPGRYTYDETGEINWRATFRGTAYHNTVVVDRKNQIRYASLNGSPRYRIQGDHAEFALREFVTTPGFDLVHGQVKSPEYDAVHDRCIAMIKGQYWIVADTLEAVTHHDYDLLFHLSEQAQGNTVRSIENETIIVHTPALSIYQPVSCASGVYLDNGYVSDCYGSRQDAPIVRFSQSGHSAVFHTILYPHCQQQPVLAVRKIPACNDQITCGTAYALEITLVEDNKRITDLFFGPWLSGSADTPNTCSGMHWRIGPYRFSGKYFWLRKNEREKITGLYMSDGASLLCHGESVGTSQQSPGTNRP